MEVHVVFVFVKLALYIGDRSRDFIDQSENCLEDLNENLSIYKPANYDTSCKFDDLPVTAQYSSERGIVA
ncbi:hypothetical protein BELL_0033g00230 [Botrytis elliptica]|uniref:Uncharacterized protein n=1 Tax=Botrytis elliptica TaxID=278938 RepID=A0A4Z1K5X5_9HELO|nr:hypothetical protein BELL_0033g00230 [Botrytis elliptica]